MAARGGIVRVVAIIVAALACRPAASQIAADVHVLVLVTQSGSLIPEPRIALSQRFALDPAHGARRVTAREGGQRITIEVIEDDDGDGLMILRDLGRGTRREHAHKRIFDVLDPFRFTRRPRRGSYTRVAILCDPVTDPTRPFHPLDVGAFFKRGFDILFEPEGIVTTERWNAIQRQLPAGAVQGMPFQMGTARWKAALLLGAVPIEDYLDPAQVDRILDAGVKPGRRVDDESWPFLRPLVALGDEATLRVLATRAGDHAPNGTIALVPEVPRSVHDAILVAYASATDPVTRGLAAWVATGTRSPDVIDALADDLKTGRAVLPGSPAEQARLTTHIVSVQAWQSVRAPVMTLIASALAIAAVLWLLQSALRGWL